MPLGGSFFVKAVILTNCCTVYISKLFKSRFCRYWTAIMAGFAHPMSVWRGRKGQTHKLTYFCWHFYQMCTHMLLFVCVFFFLFFFCSSFFHCRKLLFTFSKYQFLRPSFLYCIFISFHWVYIIEKGITLCRGFIFIHLFVCFILISYLIHVVLLTVKNSIKTCLL